MAEKKYRLPLFIREPLHVYHKCRICGKPIYMPGFEVHLDCFVNYAFKWMKKHAREEEKG